MPQGFVYILINPSIPGYIKIGKTTKAPEDRAAELSGATGVPTPFVVAYDAAFADCDQAEAYVHALLETRGVSRTPDREFFAVNLREAIAAVMEAERSLTQIPNTADPNSASAGVSESDQSPETPVWEEVFRQAEEYNYGYGDILQNKDRALVLYKQAARLGAPEAFLCLAELYAEQGNSDEGLRWLTRGAESGVVDCWVDLAKVYMGENFHFDTSPNQENARKAWRRFFRLVEPLTRDPEGDVLYGLLRLYIKVVRSGPPDPEDANAIRAFEHRFVNALTALPAEAERNKKLDELRELVASIP